jgi:DNA/RNA-binding domain of Phe-tRNA-synthetase-like protein
MMFKIFPSVIKKYPGLNIGVIIAAGADNKGISRKLTHLLEEVEEYIRMDFVPTELARAPLISPWRTAYQEFGSKPSRFNCSVEAMMKRILKGGSLPKINKLVDLCNYISLKHIIPLGIYDLDKAKPPISIRHAEGDERFIPLGSDKSECPEEGEIIYEDNIKRAICRRWNWRDSEETKVTEETKNAIIFIDGLPPITKKKIEEIQTEMQDLITAFCGGKASAQIAHKDLATVEFEKE